MTKRATGRDFDVRYYSQKAERVEVRLAQAIDLLRDAGPGLHLCRPACETSALADAWWQKREQLLK